MNGRSTSFSAASTRPPASSPPRRRPPRRRPSPRRRPRSPPFRRRWPRAIPKPIRLRPRIHFWKSTASPSSIISRTSSAWIPTGPTPCGPRRSRPLPAYSAATARRSSASSSRGSACRAARKVAGNQLSYKFEFDLFGVGVDAGADHHPLPSHLWPMGPRAGRADQHPLHGYRHLPQHHRLLGPLRHGLPAQSADPLDAGQQWPGDVRRGHREAGQRRRSRPDQGHRAGSRVRHSTPQPLSRPHGAVSGGGKMGTRPDRRHTSRRRLRYR